MTTRLDDTGLTFSDASLQAIAAGQLPGYLFGCILSTAGASTTMSITAGKAQDSTGVQLMTLAAIAKTTAAWVLGTAAGGLDTGVIAANTWYHFFDIRRPDTGLVDVALSLSATAPTFGVNIPAAFTQFRRIGSGRTNGSAQWTAFIQDGDEFTWSTTVADFNAGVTATAASVALSVPSGVRTRAKIEASVYSAALTKYVRFSDLSTVDELPGFGLGNTQLSINVQAGGGSNVGAAASMQVNTNTASQIRIRADATHTLAINTSGWTDTRGRNA